MFKPVPLFVGLRYTRTRKRNLFVSFVSVISMLGITLGVLAMIVVLSVINGSTAVMRNETLKSVPHVVIGFDAGGLPWQTLAAQVTTHPEVLAAAPFLEGEAWIRHQGQDRFVSLRGVDPQAELAVMDVPTDHMRQLMDELATTPGGMILGNRLARELGIFSNQTTSVTPLRSLLGRALDEAKGLTVLGATDFGFYGNDNVAVIGLDQAQELFPDQSVELRLRVTDVFEAARIAREAVPAELAGQGLKIVPWNESQRSLFDALRMEKMLTGFMLLMIVLIGAVNIVSTLVMVVADKSSDIAILRTMGAGKSAIMGIFIVQGSLAGLLGVTLGTVLGVLITINLTAISTAFENLVNNLLAPERLYMISYLRAELVWGDVLVIALAALLISFLATLYPAYRAARVQPAAVLRYE
ncbi:MAG: FtsX-like permease family protein [Gammaproteobacteria bacterium]|nr:ABC transporter permease [Pseudomonadales bacterium]MCP5346095.1 ABC transporter permease [Pseudomonadales bacterium]